MAVPKPTHIGKALTPAEYYAAVEKRGRPLTWPGIQTRSSAWVATLSASTDAAVIEAFSLIDPTTDDLLDTIPEEDFAA